MYAVLAYRANVQYQDLIGLMVRVLYLIVLHITAKTYVLLVFF